MQGHGPEVAAPECGAAGTFAPRPYGPFGLLVSLALMGAAGVFWFAILGAMVFGVAAALGGYDGAMALARTFQTMDARGLARADPVAQRAFFGVGSMLYLAGIAGILSVARLRGGRNFGALLGWSGPFPRLRGFAWALLAGAVVYHVAAGLTLRLLYPELSNWLYVPRDPAAMALSFAMIVVLAPLGEELLFRGWLFGSVASWSSPRGAVIICTLAFALVHWDGVGLYPLAVLIPGFVLTLIRARTGSAKPAFAGHALYNGVGWAALLAAGFFLAR